MFLEKYHFAERDDSSRTGSFEKCGGGEAISQAIKNATDRSIEISENIEKATATL